MPMLSPLGRRLRGGATAAVLVLTLLGTAYGDDDHFPVGPFRMFSTKTSRDGAVKVSLIRGVTVDGAEVRLDARPLREVRLISARWLLEDGRRVGYVEEPVAVWTRR